mgnify:CR=1 FL=1
MAGFFSNLFGSDVGLGGIHESGEGAAIAAAGRDRLRRHVRG